MNSFVLSAAITLTNPVGGALDDSDAARYVIKAAYKSFKLDQIVSKIEKKHLKLDKYPELGYIGLVARVVTEKRVTYTWRF